MKERWRRQQRLPRASKTVPLSVGRSKTLSIYCKGCGLSGTGLGGSSGCGSGSGWPGGGMGGIGSVGGMGMPDMAASFGIPRSNAGGCAGMHGAGSTLTTAGRCGFG
jgi:hypothetical protein